MNQNKEIDRLRAANLKTDSTKIEAALCPDLYLYRSLT
jgi:hypothetical protein